MRWFHYGSLTTCPLFDVGLSGLARRVGRCVRWNDFLGHEFLASTDLVYVVATVAGPLLVGGGLWLTVREIAKQIGETRRERIRQEAETQRLTIWGVLGLPKEEPPPVPPSLPRSRTPELPSPPEHDGP